jgi:hypothetical protein
VEKQSETLPGRRRRRTHKTGGALQKKTIEIQIRHPVQYIIIVAHFMTISKITRRIAEFLHPAQLGSRLEDLLRDRIDSSISKQTLKLGK